MLLNKYKRREKDAIATSDELDKLYRDRWKERWIECVPFQYGWIRDWTLRSDIKDRKDAESFRAILEVVGTQQWAKDRDFLGYPSQRRARRAPMAPPWLKSIEVRPDPYTGEETGWPASLPVSLKKWFYYHTVNAPFCNCLRSGQYYRPAHYTLKYPWMFELRVRPAFISRIPDVIGDMESKMKRLEQHMEAHQYWRLLAHMSGHSSRAYRRESYRDSLLKAQLNKEVAEEVS